MYKCNILISTYNGSSYISELIDSILHQDIDDVIVAIRDDGSTDNTCDIIHTYEKRYMNFRFYKGNNIGVINSFFKLLEASEENCSYFAFCDQDDIWKKNKISEAIKHLKLYDSEIPLLYFSKVEYVDQYLNHLGYSESPQRMTFEHALVENSATGCTIVINKRARDLIISHLPRVALMHDWWMFLVVSAFGEIIYDPEPKILYRQHSSNVVGGTTSRFEANLKKIFPFIKSVLDPSKKRTSDQVCEFKEIFGEKLDPCQIKIIDEFLEAKQSIIRRLNLVANGKFRRQNCLDNIIFSILIILGYY